MGANGSGKSTLGMALAGHPHYRVQGGRRCLAGQDLLAPPAQSARAGLFLSFQSPPDVPGVKNNLFIRTALNAVREARGQEPLDAFDFLSSAKKAAKACPAAAGRPVNEGFSGGERKRNELLQLALLQPRLALLDEIDSGMDVDGVRAVELVQALRAQGTAFIVVSHYLQMIESLQPDAVLRLDQGCIAETGDLELARASPAPALRAPAGRGGLSMDSARADILARAKPPARTAGSAQQRILSPPAAAGAGQWLARRRAGCDARPGRRRLDAAPRSAGDHGASGVDARWLDALDPAQRASCLPACPAGPGGRRGRALCLGTARCAARACACASAPRRARSANPWLHLRHQPRAQAGGAAGARGTRACAAC
jgi:Fe-S cluster assembly ATP-binding protein